MTSIIVSIIVVILAFIGLGLELRSEEDFFCFKLRKRQWLSLFGFLIILFGCINRVPANSVGIKYSPFTGVSENVFQEGMYFMNPLDTLYIIPTEVQTRQFENIYTQTADSQFLTSLIDIKYQVNKTNAFLIFKQFRNIDGVGDKLIGPTLQRSMDLVTAQYNVIDALGSKRTELYGKLQEALKIELEKSGITFYSVTLLDTDAGATVEKAIEEEAVAKKKVETAEQELLKVQTEAKQKSAQAQAEKDAAEIKAKQKIIEAKSAKEVSEIKAEQKVIEAEAEKKSNELISKSITNELLQKQYLEKWDGKLPKISSAGEMIFDVSELAKEDTN